jgi:MFS family permease
VLHARRVSDPLLDLSLLRIDTFRLSMIGGTLTRMTQGAMPFLMPMMLQLAYGLSPLNSGATTLASAAGAFMMKGMARKMLRRFGFRMSLCVVGLLAPLLYAMTGWINKAWPLALIFLLLCLCGFFISLLFTAYNSIAYAEVDNARMSRATSFYATFQQVSLSLGVCAGASALGLAMRMGGRDVPVFSDFASAIWMVCGISLTAIFANKALAKDAGAQLSGHRQA